MRKMFLPLFRRALKGVLDGNVPFFATIKLRGNTFIENIKKTKDVILFELTAHLNRLKRERTPLSKEETFKKVKGFLEELIKRT